MSEACVQDLTPQHAQHDTPPPVHYGTFPRLASRLSVQAIHVSINPPGTHTDLSHTSNTSYSSGQGVVKDDCEGSEDKVQEEEAGVAVTEIQLVDVLAQGFSGEAGNFINR